MRANNALALVFTNTSDHMLEGLTGVRSMASVPFGGRYRIIDFHLSNIFLNPLLFNELQTLERLTVFRFLQFIGYQLFMLSKI